MKEGDFLFKLEGFSTYPYPLAITSLTAEGHIILGVNQAFLTTFRLKSEPVGQPLEKVLGYFSFSPGLSLFPYEGAFYYSITLSLDEGRHLHILIRDRDLFKFHQWYHTDRLMSLGKLAGEISHELKNPLSGILLYAEMLKDEIPSGSKAREFVDKIIDLARRCRIISKTLLDFGKPDAEKKEWIDLNQVILKVYNFLVDYQIFREVEFEMKLEPKLPPFYASQTQMEQVMLNLFINAAEAMKGKGKIYVETKARPDRIIIVVEDTGPGIPTEVLPYIFDPFFTTKEGKEGAGLGLAICANIIKHHGGTITAYNAPKGGAGFQIRLPLPTREALRSDVF